jgi:hypothetical protein
LCTCLLNSICFSLFCSDNPGRILFVYMQKSGCDVSQLVMVLVLHHSFVAYNRVLHIIMVAIKNMKQLGCHLCKTSKRSQTISTLIFAKCVGDGIFHQALFGHMVTLFFFERNLLLGTESLPFLLKE